MAGKRKATKLDAMSHATRRKILVEATTLFARQGYHGTTFTDLAHAIGKTQGAIFHHFATKEDLLKAVVARLAKGFQVYRKALETPAGAAPFRCVLASMVEHYNSQPEATVCLAALATEFAGSGHPILWEIRKSYDSFVEPLSKALEAKGLSSPQAAAIAFIGAAQGVAIQGMLREGAPAMEELAAAFLGMISSSAR